MHRSKYVICYAKKKKPQLSVRESYERFLSRIILRPDLVRRIVPLMANSSKIMYKFNTINIKISTSVFET